jgi:type II secretory pathway pseudopilin PulG
VEILVAVAVMAILATLTMGVAREVINQANIKQTKTALLVLRDQAEKYKDQFNGYPTGTGGNGAPELVSAILRMVPSVTALVGTQVCPNNNTLQDAWSNPIRYYYNPSGNTVGGGFDSLYQQNNCTPLYVSPGPDGQFGTIDDVTVP